MQNEEHIYFCGGQFVTSDCPLPLCDYFMRYCLKNDYWERLPNMLLARKNHRAVLLGDQIIVVGGNNVNDTIERSCEKFSLSTKSWSRIAAFPGLMTRLVSVCIHQGNIIVVIEHQKIYNVYRYCPQTDAWTHLEQLSTKLEDLDRVDSAVSYRNELWLYCYKKEDYLNFKNFGLFLRYDFRNNSLVELDSFGADVEKCLKKNISRFSYTAFKVTTSFCSNYDLLFGHIFLASPHSVEYKYRNFHYSVFHSTSTGLNSVLPMKEAKDFLMCAVKHDKMYAFFNCTKGNDLFRVYDPIKGLWSGGVQKIISVTDYAVC